MPKVSICIPAYEQVEYLKLSLDSILNQSYSDYEIIITDDSKTDKVENLVKKYDFEGKLKYYRNSNRLGSPENWNEALRKATGEYIKIVHHDEWFNYEDSLTKFVEALDNNPQLDFAFSAARGYNVSQNHKWVHKPTQNQLANLEINPLVLFFGNFIGAPSNVIFRRNTEELFNSNLIWCVDFEFYIRLLLKKRQFYYIDYDLVTSVSNAEHNVTNLCNDNKKIEVFEYLYLYNEFSYNSSFTQNLKFVTFFRQLFTKYNIKTKEDIIDCDYLDVIPNLVRGSLFLNIILRRRA